jgi:holo-[acyl-carrier protein] synthase
VIVGLGVDLFDVPRMEAELRAPGADLGPVLFTPAEIAFCERQRHPARHYAACFAAKEAAVKALALHGRAGVCWRDAEVRPEPGGTIGVALHGALRAEAERLGVTRVLASLSYTHRVATACVLLEG